MTEPFLSRWSKRKQEAKAAPPPEPEIPKTEPVAAEPPAPPPDLPPLESLGKDSDYSPFLGKGVPPELRQQALQRLWASDPGLMVPEPFDLHMGDYTASAGTEVVKTAWRVGKGVLDAAELEAEKEAEKEAVSAPPSAKPPPPPDDVA